MAIRERAISSAHRGLVRIRCPRCSAAVAEEAETCPGCRCARPNVGWQRVADLVVHSGGRGTPIPSRSDPQVRTVYLQAVSSAAAAPTGRLAFTFGLSFVLTTLVVLGTWVLLVSGRPVADPPTATAPTAVQE